MPEICGVNFADSVAGLVERLITEIERLAGPNAVYPVDIPELRGAIKPGVNGFNAIGVFIRITPRADGAIVGHKGVEPVALTDETMQTIFALLPKWINDGKHKQAVLTKSSKQASRTTSQALRDPHDSNSLDS